jgi:hypothetical protein
MSFCVKALYRNARELPAFGHSLIVASQLPDDIDKRIAGNCANHFFGLLNMSPDVSKAGRMLSKKGKEAYAAMNKQIHQNADPRAINCNPPFLVECSSFSGRQFYFREPFRFFKRLPQAETHIKQWKRRYMKVNEASTTANRSLVGVARSRDESAESDPKRSKAI